MGSELSRILPRWLSSSEAKKFPWDDERYWKKEGRKISKEPRDYARQVGMDIENQTVETEDGYYLRWVHLSISLHVIPSPIVLLKIY
jgi:lysosomal acid lipase/cholesteryl ester hydrolase